MFFATLAKVLKGQQSPEGDGFMIITAASGQKTGDIHDRGPVAFSHEHTRE